MVLQQTVDPVVCRALLPILPAIVIDVIHTEIHPITLPATSAPVAQFRVKNGFVLFIVGNGSVLFAVSRFIIFRHRNIAPVFFADSAVYKRR